VSIRPATPAAPEPPLPPRRPAAQSVQQAFAAQATRLEAQLKGVIGVSVRHLEGGEAFSVRGQERFPMASTFKVAIAGTVLTQVDRGATRLDDMIGVTERDFDETGPIAQSVRHPGVSLSVANLIELMLTQSNNNATDRMLSLAGGPPEVTAWLRAAGVRGIRVDNTVNGILDKFYGFPAGAAAYETFLERYRTAEEREAASSALNPAFEDDPEDTATPDDMAELLSQLFGGTLLSEQRRTFLREVMERCETGLSRLRGLLPAGVVVADKTGTIGGAVNDVGMITLPEGRGRLVIAVFTKKSAIAAFASRERCIAEIARSAYDYFALR
jgi:beta-lactamase class A